MEGEGHERTVKGRVKDSIAEGWSGHSGSGGMAYEDAWRLGL